MFSKWLTITLSGVGNDIPTRLGKSRPTLTLGEFIITVGIWQDNCNRVFTNITFMVDNCVYCKISRWTSDCL